MNVGTIDRVTRVAIGLLSISLASAGSIGTWGYLGIIPLYTGFAGVCPAYYFLGLTTEPSHSL